MYSSYEVDLAARRVRRVSSKHAATANQVRYHADGRWQHFQQVTWSGDSLLFFWGLEDGGDHAIVRRTLTSTVLHIEGDFPPNPSLN